MKKKQKSTYSPRALAEDLAVPPPRPVRAFRTSDEVRAAFGLPVTRGLPEERRLAMDSAFSAGYQTLYESLTQHAASLGQYPMDGFMGYGALQQIAQNGMIRACIQTVADDMTREWIVLGGGEGKDEDADGEKEIVEKLTNLQEKRYRIRTLFNQAFALVGYMGGAFIFIDTGASGEDLAEPLIVSEFSEELTGPDRRLRFAVVDPCDVSPGDYNSSEPLAPDYMTPSTWWVMGKRVHASRLLALVDNPPPVLLRPAYNFLGIPQAQILWDYVLHWNRARTTGVELLEKLNFMVLKTNVGENLTAGGLSALDAKMQLVNRYRSNDSLFLCDLEEDVQNVTLTTSGAPELIRQSLEFIASINRTPAVKLLGISPSGFNATGESDLRNYYDHIRSKQELHRPAIETVLKAIEVREFGHIDPSITFDFAELGKDDEYSSTMNAKTKADAYLALLDRNVLSAEEVRGAIRQDPVWNMSGIDEEAPEPQADEGDDGGLAALLGGGEAPDPGPDAGEG